MKCDRCDKEALVEIHIVEGKEQRTKRFCKEHYIEFLEENSVGEDPENMRRLQQMLRDFLSSFVYDKDNYSEYEDITCSACGTGLNEVFERGTFGCDRCYEEFGSHTEDLLLRVQGQSEYCGKFPGYMEPVRKNLDAIGEKEQALKECIEKEDYEQAAVLRDEIRKLKEEIGEG